MTPINEFNANQSEYRLWQEKEDSPIIQFYPASDKKSNAAVIIFAGGGYMIKTEYEGKVFAEFLSRNGISAFVVDYSVFPKLFPLPLSDARRSVRFVRYYSEIFGLDASQIAVMGSSAGGHLAALVSTYREKIEGEGIDEIDEVCCIPNAQILCYPVISMTDPYLRHEKSRLNFLGEDGLGLSPKVSPNLIADEKTPQAFIWHTVEDGSVNVINSYEYASALRRQNVPVEMHIFPNGHHGLGLCDIFSDTPDAAKKMRRHTGMWKELLLSWLSYIGYLNLN